MTDTHALIDLRSDTVTLPTPEMVERMSTAPLGDDGLDGDPTAVRLEAATAELLGKEAGLYTPSATMANLLAILAQSERQGMVIAEASSHIFVAERGAATMTGTFYQSVAGTDGAMDIDTLRDMLAPGRNKLTPNVVCLETSHNNAGGTVLPLAHMQQAHALANDAGARVHLDGARMMNAAVALGVEPARIASHTDTVALCLSKGLSAPMGAVLVGPASTIARARWLRKLLGGAQRQVGIAAAAGLVAISGMVARLADDHRVARRLALAIQGIDRLAANDPQTNIVQVDVSATGRTAAQWETELKQFGVLVRPWGTWRLRCVTHRHVDERAIDRAVEAFRLVATAR